MATISNIFSNLNDVLKTNSNTDETRSYNKKNTNIQLQTPALSQGSKFKKYQKKIYKNTEKSMENVNSKEGFESSIDRPNRLVKRSNRVINRTNIIENRSQNIQVIQNEYNTALEEYQGLLRRLNGSTTSYLRRVNPNNPYLDKTVRFSTGHICYVTKQGVVKFIPTMDIWNSVNAPKEYINLNIPWDQSYSTPGTVIPTTPPLVSGTFMELNQALGDEGENVFVDSLVNNPTSKYLGCYNDVEPFQDIAFVPIMTPTNSHTYGLHASSIFMNDYNNFGPWAAFDKNPNTFWHSASYTDGGRHSYNGTTGEYEGSVSFPCRDRNGNQVTVRGEYLWLEIGLGAIVTKYEIQGRQGCCGQPNGRTPNSWVIIGGVYNQAYEIIDTRTNEGLSSEMRAYTISNPKSFNHYIFLTTNCGNPGNRDGMRYSVQISQWNLVSNTSWNFRNEQRAMRFDDLGFMTKDQCKNYALDNGFKYYGLQHVQQNGTAQCLISNDLARSQMYGRSDNNVNFLPLWHTHTGNRGGSAYLTNDGRLIILERGTNKHIWFSPNAPQSCWWSGYVNPDSIQGSYGGNCIGRPVGIDCGNPSPNQSYQADGLANNLHPQLRNEALRRVGNAESVFSYSSLSEWTGGDPAHCCAKTVNYAYQCGGSAFKTGSGGGEAPGGMMNFDCSREVAACSFRLVVQDDGNLCIYQDNVTNAIWCSMTNGRQREPHSLFEASKGKFGVPYLTSGQTLLPGEWVGNANGSALLMMQHDGNLVLYTSEPVLTCRKTSNGDIMGGDWVNALYEIEEMGKKENMGEVGYVDSDSVLYTYPSSNVRYTNDYKRFPGKDSGGHDIPGAAYGGATLEQCKQSCNDTTECAGFTFNTQHNVCFPKNANMYPEGNLQNVPIADVYVRGKTVRNPPFGGSRNVNSIDSVEYQRYKKMTTIPSSVGLANITSAQKQQLESLQRRLNTLSTRLVNLTGNFSNGENLVNNRITRNTETIEGFRNNDDNYLTQLKEIRQEIRNFDMKNMENILDDSNIIVLKENYTYLLWSILAVGTVIMTMNISTFKKSTF